MKVMSGRNARRQLMRKISLTVHDTHHCVLEVLKTKKEEEKKRKRKKNEEEKKKKKKTRQNKTKQNKTKQNKTKQKQKQTKNSLLGRNEERQVSWQQVNRQSYIYSISFEHLSSASFQDEL